MQLDANGVDEEVTVESDDDAVAVTVTDDDAAVEISRQSVAVREGETNTYTVRLGAAPAGPVTVVTRPATNPPLVAGADFMRRRSPLRFDASNWATAQPVTIYSAHRVNAIAGRDQFSHDVTGALSGSGIRSVGVQEVLDTVPILGAVADQTVRVGQGVNVRLGAGVQMVQAGEGAGAQSVAATAANAPLRYELTGPGAVTTLGLPAGLTFSPTTRRLWGTQGAAEVAGTYTYTLTVEDAQGDTAVEDFTLTVEGHPLPGFRAPAGRYTRWETYRLPAPEVRMGTTPMLTFVVGPALPAGLTHVPPPETMAPYTTGGQIVGTPTERLTTQPYTLTVVDRDGNEAELTFALAGAPPPAPADRQPTFGAATVPAQVYRQSEAIAPLVLPAGLTYTAPADATSGGTIAGVPAATPYTLTATDADRDEATQPFMVAVEAAGPIRPQDGTRTYVRHGRQVTLAPGTLAGMEVTLPATLAQDVRITLRPPGDEVPLARRRYGFGPAGAEIAVDLTMTPVPAAVRTAAAGRMVVMVRCTGEEWAPIVGAKDDATGGRICADGMTAFGPVAVGYANGVSTFEAQPVPL